MRYRWRDLPALARTPVGRAQIRKGLVRRLWPGVSLAARLHRRTRGRSCRVVAVVGSFGKTTTTRTASSALDLALPASGANHYEQIAGRLLAIRPGDRHAVLEVGITHPGQMEMYARTVRPDVTVVTSIGNTHQDELHTLENTAHEKAFMVRALPATGLAVLNGDDPHVLGMARETRARIVTYGLGPDADVRATGIRVEPPQGTRFQLHIGGQSRDVRIRLPGEPGVYATLAGIAVGRAEGRRLDDVLAALASLPPAPRRLELDRLPGDVHLLRDDSKSAVESIRVALDVFDRVPTQRRIVVLHEPTDEQKPDDAVFPPLGARLADSADRLFFMGTQERFDALRRGAGTGSPTADTWERVGVDPRGVAARLKALLQPGDALLLKGPMTARMGRIALALRGRTVRCSASFCDAPFYCPACPMLEPGWGSRRIVI